jgi:putative N-acetylmannosamine-6-phosphate epimerase
MPGTPNYLILPSDAANTGKELQTWANSISGQTVNTEAVTLANSSGVEEGTSANPVRIDPVGTTVQPVLGTNTVQTPEIVGYTQPTIIQRLKVASAGAGTTISGSFPNAVVAGNSIFVCGASSNTVVSVSDGVNTYNTLVTNATAPGILCVLAQAISAGTPTITFTITSSGSSAFQAYEIAGLVNAGTSVPYDVEINAAATSASFSPANVAPTQPNCLDFAFAAGSSTATNNIMAGVTFTVTSPPYGFSLDANLSPSGNAALTNFYALSTASKGVTSFGPTFNYTASNAHNNIYISLRGIQPTLSPASTSSLDGFPYQHTTILSQNLAADGGAAYYAFTDNGTGAYTPVLTASVTSGVATTSVLNREPNNFANAQLTTGASATIIASVASQKWRLLKYKIQVSANAAITGGAAVIKISLQDNGTDIAATPQYVYIPAASVAAPLGDAFDSGWIDLGKVGYVSSAVNQAMTLVASTALTSGTINAIVAYCGPAATV